MNNNENNSSESKPTTGSQNNNNDQNNSNTVKDPNEWTTGGERMTGAQRSYLKTLSDSANDPFDENLSKAEAAKKIDELQKNNKANNQNKSADNAGVSNTVKDPNDWKTGEQAMTGAQKSYLKTLSDSAGEPFDENLSKAEAAKKIDELQKNNQGNNQHKSADNAGPSNTVKDPNDWKTGEQAMTGAQKSYLKTLSDEAGEELNENLSKAEASKKIDELQQKTGRGANNNQ